MSHHLLPPRFAPPPDAAAALAFWRECRAQPEQLRTVSLFELERQTLALWRAIVSSDARMEDVIHAHRELRDALRRRRRAR